MRKIILLIVLTVFICDVRSQELVVEGKLQSVEWLNDTVTLEYTPILNFKNLSFAMLVGGQEIDVELGNELYSKSFVLNDTVDVNVFRERVEVLKHDIIVFDPRNKNALKFTLVKLAPNSFSGYEYKVEEAVR